MAAVSCDQAPESEGGSSSCSSTCQLPLSDGCHSLNGCVRKCSAPVHNCRAA